MAITIQSLAAKGSYGENGAIDQALEMSAETDLALIYWGKTEIGQIVLCFSSNSYEFVPRFLPSND